MKVGIIAASNIRFCPYIFPYVELLEKLGMDYELIHPDRLGFSDPFAGKVHTLSWDRTKPTLLNYMLYARQVTKVIKKQGYDALVVLTTPAAVFLAPWLKLHYPGRYIVDIRDYSHENNPAYFALETLAVRNSMLNVISSRRFEIFLPRAEYHCCHNYSSDALTVRESFRQAEAPLTIGYVGFLGYVEQCKKMMELVAGDDRFRMAFYGTSGQEAELRSFAETLPGDRIRFYGGYAPGEKTEIVRKVDILFNAYGNNHPLVSCLLSNKLYDAFLFKKPILTSPGTFMDEKAGLLSFPIDLETETSLDALYDWYMGLEGEKVDAFADEAMADCVREHEQTMELTAQCLQALQ